MAAAPFALAGARSSGDPRSGAPRRMVTLPETDLTDFPWCRPPPTADRTDPAQKATYLMAQYTLSESARTILTALAREGPATRPVLGAGVRLSKPTVSVAIAELAEHGLVREYGASYGKTGRSAVVYGLGPAAGHVYGIDVGRTHTTIIACTLDGSEVGHEVVQVHTGRDTVRELEVARQVSSTIAARLGEEQGPVRAIAIALPTTVSTESVGDVPMATYADQVAATLLPRDGVPVIVENNVNCAAIAELFHGVARGVDTFCYLQVGVRIGAGLVIGRHLIRGAGGFAGEISHIPYPWAPGSDPEPLGLERHLGSRALVRRVKDRWPQSEGTPPASAVELFRRAEKGSEFAREMIVGYARDVGRLTAALGSVLDPGLVVLGGGVGQNPLLLPHVRAEVAYLDKETAVETTVLGEKATALGAARIASTLALESIVGGGKDRGIASTSPIEVAQPVRVW